MHLYFIKTIELLLYILYELYISMSFIIMLDVSSDVGFDNLIVPIKTVVAHWNLEQWQSLRNNL